MKLILATAAALAIGTCASHAQNPPAQQGQSQSQQQGGDNFPSVQPPPPPGLENQQQQQTDAPDTQRGGDMMMPYHGMHHRGMHGGARTASISVEAGGAKVRVRCGADQSSDECVDMVGRLLEQVQARGGEDRDGRDRDRRWRDRDRDRDRYGDQDRRWRD